MATDSHHFAQTKQRIECKLEQAWKRGFLSKGHNHGKKFGLLPPVGEAQVAKFETQHGVLLPEAYRYFITSIGAGGAGPYYGLLSFADVMKHCDHAAANEESSRLLADSCPMWPGTPDCVESPLREDSDPWDSLLRGTLTIALGGCSDILVLIVTGKYRGRVVDANLEDNGRPWVSLDTDFLAWYERWLDELLGGWRMSGFSIGYPGNEQAIFQALQTPPNWADFREAALRSLLRMPALDEASQLALMKCLDDDREQVRELAAHGLGHHSIRAGGNDLTMRITDSDPDVRVAAIRALAALKHPGWVDLARSLLHDVNHEVVFASVCALRQEGPIEASDLMHLFDSADPRNRTTAIFAWANTGLPLTSSSWFTKIVEDEDRRVLSQLVCLARDRKEKAILPYLDLIEARLPGVLRAEIESTRRSLAWSYPLANAPSFLKRLTKLPSLLSHYLRWIFTRRNSE